MPLQRIAVLGAGYVGGALARAAADAGHAVWAVRRAEVSGAGDGVHWRRGDVTTGAIDGLPGALDVVVLTVAPGGSGYDTVYPPAASHALALARASGATCVVYTSSTGVYGGRDGAWVDEATVRGGAGEANAALIAAEDVLLDGDVPAYVLRVAGIYGPGRDPRGRFRAASQLAQRGTAWVNLAHRDDVVSAVLHAVGRGGPTRARNVSDGMPVQAAEVCRWLTAQAWGDVHALQFTSDAAPARNDQRVSNAALVREGWQPRYPSFREGFARGL